jgi:hypothetical protein
VGKVFCKVRNEVPERLACFYVFLSAVGTIGYVYYITAVFAGFIMTKVVASHTVTALLVAKAIKNYRTTIPLIKFPLGTA